MNNKPFGLTDELLINPELKANDIPLLINIRLERIETITEMLRVTIDEADTNHNKKIIDSALFTIDHMTSEIEAFIGRYEDIAKQ